MSGNRAGSRMFFSLAADLSSARLLSAMQAVKDSHLVDRETGLALVARARAVRAFLAASEDSAARNVLGELIELALDEPARGIVDRRVNALLGCMAPNVPLAPPPPPTRGRAR
jgi:hypothetical protein